MGHSLIFINLSTSIFMVQVIKVLTFVQYKNKLSHPMGGGRDVLRF